MNIFYVVWDYVDERLFDKRNSSDCAQFSELLGWPTSSRICSYFLKQRTKAAIGWAIFWFIWEALVFTSAIFAGIAAFQVSESSI